VEQPNARIMFVEIAVGMMGAKRWTSIRKYWFTNGPQ